MFRVLPTRWQKSSTPGTLRVVGVGGRRGWGSPLLSKSTIDWLSDVKPTLMIELHNALLKKRGLTSGPLLKRLKSLGYKVKAADTPLYTLRRNTHVMLEA